MATKNIFNTTTNVEFKGGSYQKGGFFKGDADMPLFARREGEAALAYLNLLLDISDASKARVHEVNIEGKLCSMTSARHERDKLLKNYRDIVAEETLLKEPNATPADIKRRQQDILAANSNTAYIPSQER